MDIHLLERLKDIVRSAGTTVRSAQDAAMGIREKSSHVDLVTLYDPMVQEFLRSRLLTLLPEAGFLGEEDATHDIAGRRQLFIVDPIDGTMNFIRGLHHRRSASAPPAVPPIPRASRRIPARRSSSSGSARGARPLPRILKPKSALPPGLRPRKLPKCSAATPNVPSAAAAPIPPSITRRMRRTNNHGKVYRHDR